MAQIQTAVKVNKKVKEKSRRSGKDNGNGSLSFKVGDTAVYPAHGVCHVAGIESREISGYVKQFYILEIKNNGMTIMVPIDNVEQVGLRRVIEQDKVEEVFNILRKNEISVDNQTWNRRYREYNEKIRTGSVYEIAAVLRDLSLLKLGKDLSFGERKMLDTARNLLIREVSLAQRIDESEVEKELSSIFSC